MASIYTHMLDRRWIQTHEIHVNSEVTSPQVSQNFWGQLVRAIARVDSRPLRR